MGEQFGDDWTVIFKASSINLYKNMKKRNYQSSM